MFNIGQLKNLNISKDSTLNELFDVYLVLYSHSRSPHTILSKVKTWQKHLKHTIGVKSVRGLTFIDYQIFLNNLLNDLKPKTVKNIKHDIQAVVNIAIKLGIIIENPLKFVELPKFDNKVYFNLSFDLQKKYIQSILNFDEPVYRNIFTMLLHGRRLGEVLNLRWEHIDFSNRLYKVPSSINKARRDMLYKFTDTLQEVFEYQLFLSMQYPNDGYVFFNPLTGTKYHDVRKAWRRLQKKNNLPYIRIHDIRHLIGTYAINYLDLPIEKVSQTLGHTNIVTTQRYVTLRPENAKEVIDKVLQSTRPE